MIIVVEYVLIENFLINLIILKTTSMLTKEGGRWLFLSAFFGACLTVAMPAMYLSAIGSFLVEVGVAIVSICISFKFKKIKKFAILFSTYFISAFLYGGACYFFESYFGITSLIVILAIVVTLFVIVRFVIKRINRKRAVEKFCYEVTLVSDGRETKWKAFLDSGNLLFDPLTNKPVTLINFKVFSSLFVNIELEDILRKSDKLKNLNLAHYINFNTLGKGSKILVFQVDSLMVGEKVVEKATLGLCFQNFKEAFDSDIILNGDFALNLQKC